MKDATLLVQPHLAHASLCSLLPTRMPIGNGRFICPRQAVTRVATDDIQILSPAGKVISRSVVQQALVLLCAQRDRSNAAGAAGSGHFVPAANCRIAIRKPENPWTHFPALE